MVTATIPAANGGQRQIQFAPEVYVLRLEGLFSNLLSGGKPSGLPPAESHNWIAKSEWR